MCGKSVDTAATVAEVEMHVHDLHATSRHLLGLNPEKLTDDYAARDFRLSA